MRIISTDGQDRVCKMKGLNLGAGRYADGRAWKKEGWVSLDHGNSPGLLRRRPQAWDLPYKDESFDCVFSRHMIAHIPNLRAERVFAEVNRVLKPGGVFRVLTSDLRALAEAYVNNDMARLVQELPHPVQDELGPGAIFMGWLVAPGLDNVVLNHDYSEIIGTYAHLWVYDREMLEKLLVHYGFTINREHCNIDSSAIPDHKDLRPAGRYDDERSSTLVVECSKNTYVPFDPDHPLFSMYPYNYRMLTQESRLLKLFFRGLGFMYSIKFRGR